MHYALLIHIVSSHHHCLIFIKYITCIIYMLGAPHAPTCLTHASGVGGPMLALCCSTYRRLLSTSWCHYILQFLICLHGVIVLWQDSDPARVGLSSLGRGGPRHLPLHPECVRPRAASLLVSLRCIQYNTEPWTPC